MFSHQTEKDASARRIYCIVVNKTACFSTQCTQTTHNEFHTHSNGGISLIRVDLKAMSG